jgi:acetyltransferase
MQMIIDYARAEGVQAIEGQVLRENTTMLAMCKELGFDIIADPNDVVICTAKLTMLKKIGCTDDSMGH